MRLLVKYEDHLQLLSGIIIAAWVAWILHLRGWPWYNWLPVAFLTMVGVGLVWVLGWFARRKLTYQRRAAAAKADLRRGGDGWPETECGRGGA